MVGRPTCLVHSPVACRQPPKVQFFWGDQFAGTGQRQEIPRCRPRPIPDVKRYSHGHVHLEAVCAPKVRVSVVRLIMTSEIHGICQVCVVY